MKSILFESNGPNFDGAPASPRAIFSREKVYLRGFAPGSPAERPLVHSLRDRGWRGDLLRPAAARDVHAHRAADLPDAAVVADVGLQGAAADRQRLLHVRGHSRG